MFLFVERDAEDVSVWGADSVGEDKPKKDKCELKPATALSDAAINAPQTRALKYTIASAHISVAHAPSAADSRALSPITTERGSAAC